MRTLAALCLSAITSSLATSAAMAGELPVNWTGPYAGAQAGIGWLSGEDDMTPQTKQNVHSGTFGAFAGYDYMFGNYVAGAELATSLTNFRGTSPSGYTRMRSNWTASATVRAGYALGRFLPYLSAGAGAGNYKLETTVSNLEAEETFFGYVLGGGVEAKITQNVSLRLDYKHFEFSKKTFDFNYAYIPPFKLQGKADALNLGVAYRF
jgi:outer membrane immunogenic protein